MYQAPVAWSKLPVLTKSCKTIQAFNYHVKRYFINAYSSSMEAYRVILSYLVTGTITQLCIIFLYSQVYAGAIVMLTGVHTCANV